MYQAIKIFGFLENNREKEVQHGSQCHLQNRTEMKIAKIIVLNTRLRFASCGKSGHATRLIKMGRVPLVL